MLPATPTAADLASYLAARLDEAGLAYAFGGALALGAWGVPRATSDVDVAVFAGEHELPRILDALERGGADVDAHLARQSVARGGFFVATLARTRIDVFLAHHPWHADMERRRVQLPAPDGGMLWFVSAEDIAIAKLLYGRSKDEADLERLFAVCGKGLDLDYIELWVSRIIPQGDPRRDRLASLRASLH